MKIYEKPLAIINKFEVEDVIATSGVKTPVEMYEETGVRDESTGTVTFKW